jgi:hypothetical protein
VLPVSSQSKARSLGLGDDVMQHRAPDTAPEERGRHAHGLDLAALLVEALQRAHAGELAARRRRPERETRGAERVEIQSVNAREGGEASRSARKCSAMSPRMATPVRSSGRISRASVGGSCIDGHRTVPRSRRRQRSRQNLRSRSIAIASGFTTTHLSERSR